MKLCALPVTLFLFAALASGCASVRQGAGGGSKFSPGDLITQRVEKVDLVGLLSDNADKSSVTLEGDDFVKALDGALREFAVVSGGATGENSKKITRNRIQDRLIMASNVLCEDYKVYLKRRQSTFNFGFGTVATLFGAAGALVPYAETAKALSGAAAATTGIRAEYNEDFYANITAHVITKAINQRRGDILNSLRDPRAKVLADYSMEAAIADVITYHGACTLISGLEVADKAISKLENNVGLDTTLRILSIAAPPAPAPTTPAALAPAPVAAPAPVTN